MTRASTNQFLEERRRTRRFFNRMSPLYPIVERHLFPEYRRALGRIGLPPELRVLDLATGTGLLAGAFSERGHAVLGLDFADKLLKRARRRFPRVDFRHFDLLHLVLLPTLFRSEFVNFLHLSTGSPAVGNPGKLGQSFRTFWHCSW
jgi:ubiquinone/menaquinone biosynthesis C-methylase UbiE